jgi:uncharacterized membrane protein YkvA (DUF1232 family)
MREAVKSRARALKSETFALYLAFRDPRTPWYAKAVAACSLAYAISPIDLIPDFVPVLGYLDDLIIVPAGIALTLRLIPPGVMDDARVAANEAKGWPGGRLGWLGAVFIALLWIVAIAWVIHLLLPLLPPGFQPRPIQIPV